MDFFGWGFFMILSAIAAMAANRVIGLNNKLPWHLPEDLKFFREKTKNKVLIMGRKTFESLGQPLPNRFHIVITRQEAYRYEHPNVQVVRSLAMAIELAHMLSDKYKQKFGDEVFIVGGGEIYKESLDVINRLYLTVIEKDFVGDAYFPEFDTHALPLKEKQDLVSATQIPFSFCTYERS